MEDKIVNDVLYSLQLAGGRRGEHEFRQVALGNDQAIEGQEQRQGQESQEGSCREIVRVKNIRTESRPLTFGSAMTELV